LEVSASSADAAGDAPSDDSTGAAGDELTESDRAETAVVHLPSTLDARDIEESEEEGALGKHTPSL
jgi:hypothetical protein